MPRFHEKTNKALARALTDNSGNGSQRDVTVCAHELGFSREIEWLKIIDFSQTSYDHVRQKNMKESDISVKAFERWLLDIQL